MTEPGTGPLRAGKGDDAEWWDDLLEDVANLAGELTEVEGSPSDPSGWGKERERLAVILSQSDPALAAAAGTRGSNGSPRKAPRSDRLDAPPSQPRLPTTLPPPPPAQPARGAPPGPRPTPPGGIGVPGLPPAAGRPGNAAATRAFRQYQQQQSPPVPRPSDADVPQLPPPIAASPAPPAPPEAPHPAFVLAAPGTVFELPDTSSPVVAPWESNPGYVAPAQQTVATDMPTLGVPVAPGFVDAVTQRGFRPAGARLHTRVRVLWERLMTRQQAENLMMVALIVGILLGAALIVVMVFVLRVLFS